MKKSLIALTVAGVAAGSAMAVDLDSKTPVSTVNFASELTIAGTGLEVTTTETVTNKTGFTITDAAPRFFKYTLTNGNFVSNPTSLVITPGSGSSGTVNVVQSSGGAGSDFVLYEVAASAGGTITNDSVAVLTLGAGDNLGLEGGTVTVNYEMFEFGGGGGTGLLANAGPGTLAASSRATLVSPVSGTQTSATSAVSPVETTKSIDVANDSLTFAAATGGAANVAVNSLGSVVLTDSAFVTGGGTGLTLLDSNGVDARYGTGAGAVVKTSTVEVVGDFSAVKSAFISTSCSAAAAVTGTIATDDSKATFTTGATPWGVESWDATAMAPFVSAVVNVCIEVTGTDVISEGSYSATYTPSENAQYTFEPVSFDLNSLTNTGSTAVLNLTLTPADEGGAYKNFFRVTNLGSNEGRVFIRLINDAGESSATIDMEDVYSDGVNTVAGGGSSRQFEINDVYAAVVAADPTFSVGDAPANKLRTVITGEFGAINVQTYTVSIDGNSFSTF